MIQYFCLKCLSAIGIKSELDSALSESALSFTTIKHWVTEFKQGLTSCQSEPCSGRPNEVTTSEVVKRIHKAILDDSRLKVRELAVSKKYSASYITWKFGHEKVVWKMVVAFSHTRTKTVPWRCLNWVFSKVLQQQSRIFAPFHNHGCIISHPRKKTVKTMDSKDALSEGKIMASVFGMTVG